MSGHSKWANIKHKKAATDKKRANIFAKLARAITVAAATAGGDADSNYTLRTEVERAKSLNMPKDKIETAIKKGTGELKKGTSLEEFVMEAYGPGNSALLIEVITDNKNRAMTEVKQILIKNNGKFVSEGGVKWMFGQLGVLRISKKQIQNMEELELLVIDKGAQDIKEEKDYLTIYTSRNNLQKIQTALGEDGLREVDASLEWIAKEKVELSEKENKRLENLFEMLDENDDVQEIYSNTK